MTKDISVKINRTSSRYDINIGSDLYSSVGEWAAKALGQSDRKIVIVSNKKVFGLYGDAVVKSLAGAGFKASVCLIGDGERFKSFKTLQSTLKFFGENKLNRTDAVFALGGGVVGDLAGFAASVYLRGIEFLQAPTTLLSMIDSSVGGKTGINTDFGKNLVGSFYQPSGVLIDVNVLRTLPKREMTAGFCEAIKQGAISGRKLFDQTATFLQKREDLADLIVAQIAFKAKIVIGDERESSAKTDAKSRKILNFGHTFAHALERVTDYRYLKHGEAVGYGIIFAAELSKKLELLTNNEVQLLNDVVRRAGKLPPIDKIDPSKVLDTFKYDKKLIGNSLQWILLNGIGKPVIVSQDKIPSSVVKATIRKLIR